MSVVIPAYNEEQRLEDMLEEAVTYLDETYGRIPYDRSGGSKSSGTESGMNGRQKFGKAKGGYEILLVNDGSKDRTVEVALEFSRKKGLHGIFRVITLKENRGKGGAVTHGFRHVRGAYAVFADADGASRFTDLGRLVEGCKKVEDGEVAEGRGRGVAVGSRAHLVGSEAVVKVSHKLFIHNPIHPPSKVRHLSHPED
jgi:dolichyl-phosphate beta-glucosyltransferase